MSDLTNHRMLEEIGDELGCVIRYRTEGVLKIGRLLNEAKEVASHREWLPFLKLYRVEPRSAQNYMKAATWADAWANANAKPVSYLARITAKAIYELATGKYADDVVEQVISAAQHHHIGLKDVKAIAKVGEKAPILKEIKAAIDAKAAAEKALEDARAAERLAEAKAAGFDTVETHEAAIAEEAEKQRQADQAVDQEDGAEFEDAEDEDEPKPNSKLESKPAHTGPADDGLPLTGSFPIVVNDNVDTIACSIIKNLGKDKAALLAQALKTNLAVWTPAPSADTTASKTAPTKHYRCAIVQTKAAPGLISGR
jgi:hypothetical protein